MQVNSSTQKIYKRDSAGSTRVWWADIGTDGSTWAWRTNSGMDGGKIVTSGWKSVEQKNVGKTNWAGYIKRFILQLPDGREFGAGVRGTQEVMKKLFESNEKPTWATLRYFTPTPDGVPRFPVVIDWGVGARED